MYEPNSVEAIIAALQGSPQGGSVPDPRMQLAGSVVPLPIQPDIMAGPPPLSEIVQGQKEIKAGNPAVLQHPARADWYDRLKVRAQIPGTWK